jgi:hypothetical protein
MWKTMADTRKGKLIIYLIYLKYFTTIKYKIIRRRRKEKKRTTKKNS